MVLKRLFLNAGTNALEPIIKACIALVMSPIILHALGNYDYGIWEIVFSVVGYMGILDLGLQPAIVRFVARYSALKQPEELQKIYSSSLLCLGVVGAALCLTMFLGAVIVPGYLSPPDGDRTRFGWFLAIIGLQLLIIFPGSVFDCFLQGLQRYSMRSGITVINMLVGTPIIAFFLLRGYGLLTLALIDIIGRLCRYIVFGFLLYRPVNGGYLFRRRNVSRATLTEMFSFGVKNLVYAISARLSTTTDPLVIGAFLGAAVVPFYVIPANLVGYARNLVWQATDVLMPFFSQMDALGDQNDTRNAYFKLSRYTIGVLAPMMVGMGSLGPEFITLWMGAQYAVNGKQVLYVLVAASAVLTINPHFSRYLIGTNNHGILAKVGLATSIINVILSVALVYFIGIVGVAAGTLIAYSIAQPYLLLVVCRTLDVRVWDYVRKAVIPVIPPTLAQIAFLWGVKRQWVVDSYPVFFLAAAGSVFVFIILFFYIAFEQAERKWLVCKLKAVMSGVKDIP